MDYKKFNLKIAPLPSAEYVYDNAMFVNAKDYEIMKNKVGSKNLFYAKVRNFVFLIKPNERVELGCIAIGKIFRGMIALSGTGTVDVDCNYYIFFIYFTLYLYFLFFIFYLNDSYHKYKLNFFNKIKKLFQNNYLLKR